MCGNGIVERGEDCDDLEVQMNMSACCDTNCKLRPGALCDSTSSVCCTPNCTAAPTTQRCWDSSQNSECRAQSFCNGRDVNVCLDGEVLPDNEICGDKQVCLSGRCEPMCATASSTTVESVCQCITLPGGVSNFTDGLSCPMGICENGVCRTDLSLSRKTKVINRLTKKTVLAVVVLATPGFVFSLFIKLFDLDTKQKPRIVTRKSKLRKSYVVPFRQLSLKKKMRCVSILEIERTASNVKRKTFR